MKHVFDVEVANEYGLLPSIILENIGFWVAHNQANETNFHDGRYWTYNSQKAFGELFPYASEKQIRTALKKLKDEDLILVGNYNASAYDRTTWYTLSDKGESICRPSPLHLPSRANGCAPEGGPIPDINTDIKPDINNNPPNPPKGGKKIPPTIEEVREYAQSRGNVVDPDYFFDYYEGLNWMRGKTKVKDWQATYRTWERRADAGSKRAETGKSDTSGNGIDYNQFIDVC